MTKPTGEENVKPDLPAIEQRIANGMERHTDAVALLERVRELERPMPTDAQIEAAASEIVAYYGYGTDERISQVLRKHFGAERETRICEKFTPGSGRHPMECVTCGFHRDAHVEHFNRTYNEYMAKHGESPMTPTPDPDAVPPLAPAAMPDDPQMKCPKCGAEFDYRSADTLLFFKCGSTTFGGDDFDISDACKLRQHAALLDECVRVMERLERFSEGVKGILNEDVSQPMCLAMLKALCGALNTNHALADIKVRIAAVTGGE